MLSIRIGCLWLILAGLFLVSCKHGYRQLTPWEGFGMVPAVSGREDAEQSLKIVNEVLKGKGFRLEGDWQGDLKNDTDVRVFFVRPEGLPEGTIARSDVANRVIFISSDWKAQAKEVFGDFSDSVTHVMTLAIVLLHETGHVVKYRVPINHYIALDSLRLSHPANMVYELYADIFAANEIKAAEKPLSADLGRQLLMLGKYVDADYHFRYDFNGLILSDMAKDHNRLYHDNSYDHPNLNLRFAFMDYFLFPTKAKMTHIEYVCHQRKLSYPVPGPVQYLKIIKDS